MAKKPQKPKAAQDLGAAKKPKGQMKPKNGKKMGSGC